MAQPDEIANLFAWYKADNIIDGAEPTNLDDVTLWYDSSGNGYDLTNASTSAEPIYRDDLYAFPVVRFLSSWLQAFTASDWKFLHDGTGCTVFIVWKTRLANPNLAYSLFDTGAIGSSDIGSTIFFDDRTPNDACVANVARGAAGQFTESGVTPDLGALSGEWHITAFRFIDDNPTNRLYMSTDGGFGGYIFSNEDLYAVSTANPSGALTIGNRYSKGTFPLDGDISEIVIYNDFKTGGDLVDVHEYLAAKYAILDGIKVFSDSFSALTAIKTSWYGFPGLIAAANNDLVSAHVLSTTHASNDGTLRIRISDDHGVTWGSVTTPFSASGYYARMGFFTKLANNNLIVSMGRFKDAVVDAAISISDDNGVTWGTQYVITHSFTDSIFDPSAVLELANGDLLDTIYGKDTGDTYWTVRVSKSTNDGVTWAHLADVADGESDSKLYSESGMFLKTNGDIFCIFREENSEDYYYSISDDSGATWSAPAVMVTDISGFPNPYKTSDGVIVLPTRLKDGSADDGDLVLLSSFDEGATWQRGYELYKNTSDPYTIMVYGQVAEDNLSNVFFVSGRQWSDSLSDVLFFSPAEIILTPDFIPVSRFSLNGGIQILSGGI